MKLAVILEKAVKDEPKAEKAAIKASKSSRNALILFACANFPNSKCEQMLLLCEMLLNLLHNLE